MLVYMASITELAAYYFFAKTEPYSSALIAKKINDGNWFKRIHKGGDYLNGDLYE
jgi:hypothetical protein